MDYLSLFHELSNIKLVLHLNLFEFYFFGNWIILIKKGLGNKNDCIEFLNLKWHGLVLLIMCFVRENLSFFKKF